MSLLYVLGLLVAGVILFTPFALLARRWLPGLPGGGLLLVLLGAAGLYCLEHLIFLSPVMLWLLWLGLAGLAWALSQDLRRTDAVALPGALGLPPGALLALALCVLWPLIWRWTFPSVYASSEKLTNLLFLQNFLYAESLPAIDRWLPPYKFDFYYPLQYYLMGLPGRMLNLNSGILYQSGIVLFIAASLFTAYRLGWMVTGSTRKATLLAVLLGAGGTGAAMISVPWHYHEHRADDQNPAFVSLTAEARFNGKVFNKIFGEDAGPQNEVLPQEQPLEYFAYQIFLGDYHPTLSSFFLALVLLALLYALARNDHAIEHTRVLLMLLGGVPMLMLACNSWMFPHTVIIGGCWLLWRTASERDLARFQHRFAWMAAGALLSVLILLPHLQGLAGRSFNIGVKLVPAEYRGSLIPYIIQFWPLYLFCALALILGRLRTVAAFIAGTTLILLAFNALIFVNDLSINVYERTNSALKWWSWTWLYGLFGTAAMLLAAERGWVRKIVYVVAALLLAPLLPMSHQLIMHHGDDVGRIFGDHVYVRDHTNKSIVGYLREQPPGLAIEDVKSNAYDDSGALALLGNKAVYLGWPDHQYTWRGGFGEVGARKESINALFAGTLPEPGGWARSRDIEYIIWSGRDCREGGGLETFTVVDRRLRPEYRFVRTEYWGDCPVGVWRPDHQG